MNLSNIILQFAQACKDAQVILNKDIDKNTQISIKEVEFTYNLECTLNFEAGTSVSCTFFATKVQASTKLTTGRTEGLNLRILFVSNMVLTSETVESPSGN